MLILIMIDGLSADYMASSSARLPHLQQLREQGFYVESLEADVPATSLPGRSSIITGVDSSVHGIYGNIIWDGSLFRYANPDDVRVPTLPRRALEAGLDVAVLGYGMVRPEDASVFHHPWWANEMLQRARDLEPIPADESWLRAARHRDSSGRLAALAAAGLADSIPDAYSGQGDTKYLQYLAAGLTGDQTMLQWSAGLASSTTPPDLLLTEILIPDSVQHLAGYKNPIAHWSLSYADSLVGTLLTQLERAGVLEQSTLVITSDHGHGTIERALHPHNILPELPMSCEGGFLYVALDSPEDAPRMHELLAPYGVSQHDGSHLPTEQRQHIACFLAPAGTSFEQASPGDASPQGAPRYRSGHGFIPGSLSDQRFAIFYGAGVPIEYCPQARSGQLTPTMAQLLGLSLDPYPDTPLW